MLSLSENLYGKPPAKDALKSERLRYVRGFYIRTLPITLFAYIFIIVLGPPTWMIAMLAVVAVVWIQGFTSLSLRIRREDRA